MKKEMLINVLQPEECRIAILEDGVLEELYVERTGHESYVGNIYKGRVVNIEPSIQAAFVDFGVGRNGFLHVSDVEPAYYRHLEPRRERGDRERGGRDRDDRGPRRGNGRDRKPAPPDIEDEYDFFEEPAPAPSPGEEGAENLAPHARPADPGFSTPDDEIGEGPAGDEEYGLERVPEGESAGGESADEAPAAEALEAAEPPAADEPAAEAGLNPPLKALPETQIEEEETSRPRRRARGGPRRRRGGAEPEAEQAPAGEGESAAKGEGAEATDSGPPEKPPLMESAERRTTERESGPGSAPEVSPPPGGAGHEDDDLLFFPKSEPEPQAAPPARQPEPEPEPEPEFEPAEERREPPPPFVPPRRPRPAPSRGSVEDDLEADLAAAEIGEVEVAGTSFEVETEHEPEAEREPAETTFGEGLDEGMEEAPVRRAPREERRGYREGGRGDRGDRGDRGGRDRDRGPRGRGFGRGGRDRGRPGAGRPKPLIQDIFKRGQEVLVQVIKEGIGTKGPTLSTYISIPGRYLVVMPHLNRVGVSRKIEDDEQRRRLREIFNELKPPRGLGFIMRTAAIDKNKKELQRDLAYLSRIWQVVVRRIRKLKAPAEIYQESDMITRTIRDTFTSDIDSITVDEAAAYEHAKEFMEVVMPRFADRIHLYDGKDPLFHHRGIEAEIARIQQRKIPLPHGGSIVIEQTEALVAIDVNSGNFRADRQDAEETAFQMNLQAAKEIARQLRLRDLGGVIVNDFIDMRDEKHRRAVEKAMRDAVKRDRARTKILKISAFGLIEMTRQRIRPSLKRSVYQDCPYCHGMAQVKTCESMSIEVMRMLQLAAHRENVARIEVRVADDVANYLLNKKRREISRLEESGEIQVFVTGAKGVPPETLDFTCLDNNGNEVKFLNNHDERPPARPYRR
jgi:ribonuclease E